MRLNRTLCLTALTLALAWTAASAPLQTTTGILTFDIEGRPLDFYPDPTPNLQITAPFENAMPGDTFNGTVDFFTFTTMPENFDTGLYVVTLGLRPVPASTATFTLTGPGTFEASLTVYLDATFNYIDNGCGAMCGDVIGEFGSLPGLDNCVNGPGTATCQASGLVTLAGNYVPGAAGEVAALIDGAAIAPAAVPEPSSLWLAALGVGLLVRRRFYNKK